MKIFRRRSDWLEGVMCGEELFEQGVTLEEVDHDYGLSRNNEFDLGITQAMEHKHENQTVNN